MSLCYDFQKWTILTMLAVLAVCLVGMYNLAHGQNQTNQTSKEMVDKLINDTYANTKEIREYRAELINRLSNTECENHEYRFGKNISDYSTSAAENAIKECIENGWSLNKTKE